MACDSRSPFVNGGGCACHHIELQLFLRVALPKPPPSLTHYKQAIDAKALPHILCHKLKSAKLSLLLCRGGGAARASCGSRAHAGAAACGRRSPRPTVKSAPISDNARIRLNEAIHIVFLISFIIKRHPLTRFSSHTHFSALPYAYQ